MRRWDERFSNLHFAISNLQSEPFLRGAQEQNKPSSVFAIISLGPLLLGGSCVSNRLAPSSRCYAEWPTETCSRKGLPVPALQRGTVRSYRTISTLPTFVRLIGGLRRAVCFCGPYPIPLRTRLRGTAAVSCFHCSMEFGLSSLSNDGAIACALEQGVV